MPDINHNHSKSKSLAIHHVVKDVPLVDPGATVAEVFEILKNRIYTFNEAILVVDSSQTLLGYLEYQRLFASAPDKKMSDLIRSVNPISWDTDEEHAAGFAIKNGLSWVPVCSADQKFMGVIPSREIQRILQAEHVEDLHILAGIKKEERRTLQAMEAPPVRRTWHRVPWLLLGLLISSVSAFFISQYETLLAKNFAVFLFVPAVVYLADAVGTQTEAIVVRGISLTRLSFSQMFGSEIRTGAFIGLILGTISLAAIVFFLKDLNLAIAVGAAIFSSAFVASAMGLLFPWLLNSFGIDPAFGSGPIATVFQDTITVIIYFLITNLLLG